MKLELTHIRKNKIDQATKKVTTKETITATTTIQRVTKVIHRD